MSPERYATYESTVNVKLDEWCASSASVCIAVIAVANSMCPYPVCPSGFAVMDPVL